MNTTLLFIVVCFLILSMGWSGYSTYAKSNEKTSAVKMILSAFFNVLIILIVGMTSPWADIPIALWWVLSAVTAAYLGVVAWRLSGGSKAAAA